MQLIMQRTIRMGKMGNAQNNQNNQSNQSQGQESHTVTGKENLYRIAIQYYGDGSAENVEKLDKQMVFLETVFSRSRFSNTIDIN